MPVLVLVPNCAHGGDRLLVPVLGAGCRCWCVSWLCTWWRQVSWCCKLAVHVVETGCWCRCWCWCCELAVHVVETGCWCRCWCWVPGAGAGAGAVSWLCTWWRQVTAGAGCRCWCWVPGAGWCWCCELAVHVVETGCWCWCWAPVLVL